jgi:hypothetical protein
MTGHTSFFIAHPLSTITAADQAIEMGGVGLRLYRSQFRGEIDDLS